VNGRPFAFADPSTAARFAAAIRRLAPADRRLRLVHVCGTHEAAITEHGLRRLLPENVEVLEGPGCPVCVTPTHDIDAAVQMAESGAVVCAFGDMMRVPGTRRTLAEARAGGADVRTVLSAAESATIARQTRRDVVFFAVGFETTAPMTAAVLLDKPPENLSVLVSHKLIPEAMACLLELPGASIDGFVAPGHVSTIIGATAYEGIASRFAVPVVVAGFEPLDVLYATALLLRQFHRGTAEVENAFPRAVSWAGNHTALELIRRVFIPCDTHWRGIGVIPNSGLTLRDAWAAYDARTRFDIAGRTGDDVVPGCRCADMLTARAVPTDCPLFGTACTPQTPVGPCMVGAEGACSIWHRYGGRPTL